MNTLADIITYVRRIIKSPSNAEITDDLIIDYINRFWLMDVDARMQLFDLKTTYQFQMTPGQTNYNMPLYDVQTETTGQTIANFPVYQGFSMPCFVNGIQVPFFSQRTAFTNLFPLYIQSLNPASVGDGINSNYTISLPFFPAIPGHVDMAGIIATGVNQDPPQGTTINPSIPSTSIISAVYFTAEDALGNTYVVADSGQYYAGTANYGMLFAPNTAPFGYKALSGGYSTSLNTVNYQTGVANVTFTNPTTGAPVIIPENNPIQAQCYFYEAGLPRAVLYYNNVLSFLPPPNIPYLVSIDAYLTPAAFLSSTNAIPFGYMAEYIARGAARKILSDTGDVEQFMFYEPLFKEQEQLVWKRSQRIFTSTRTQTIFSESGSQGSVNALGQGSGT